MRCPPSLPVLTAVAAALADVGVRKAIPASISTTPRLAQIVSRLLRQKVAVWRTRSFGGFIRYQYRTFEM